MTTIPALAAGCQPVSSAPLVFHPGECFTFAPQYPAPWWDLGRVTVANLGWWITGFLVAGIILSALRRWLADRFEVTRRGSRLRVSRRWYGPHAHVVLRADEGDDPDRYTVLNWITDQTAVPWLLVHKLDPEYLTWWDEDAEAFWAPVTDFAPYAVRRLRPHVVRFGPAPVPWLTRYLPLRQPAGYLEGAA